LHVNRDFNNVFITITAVLPTVIVIKFTYYTKPFKGIKYQFNWFFRGESRIFSNGD